MGGTIRNRILLIEKTIDAAAKLAKRSLQDIRFASEISQKSNRRGVRI
jgi:hypothetical protein